MQNFFGSTVSGRTYIFFTTTTSDAVSQGGVATAEPREDPAYKQSTIGPSGLVPNKYQQVWGTWPKRPLVQVWGTWPTGPLVQAWYKDPVGQQRTCSQPIGRLLTSSWLRLPLGGCLPLQHSMWAWLAQWCSQACGQYLQPGLLSQAKVYW